MQAVGTLLTQTFMQVGCTWEGGWNGGAGVPTHTCLPKPLNLRLEHEKRRKEIKESWHRAEEAGTTGGAQGLGGARAASSRVCSPLVRTQMKISQVLRRHRAECPVPTWGRSCLQVASGS